MSKQHPEDKSFKDEVLGALKKPQSDQTQESDGLNERPIQQPQEEVGSRTASGKTKNKQAKQAATSRRAAAEEVPIAEGGETQLRKQQRKKEDRIVNRIVLIVVLALLVIGGVLGFSMYRYVTSGLQPLNPEDTETVAVEIPSGSSNKAIGEILEEVTADSGYCSEKNLLYLKDHKITSYIKLQDHEKRKTRAYTENIGKYYNMKTQIFEDELYYVCHDGRELHHIRTEKKEQAGYTQTFEVYGCADCSGCEHKAKCLYKYDAEKDAEKNKVMKVNGQWEALKEESHANIQSEKGILNRQIRSIQTEGHFGDIKENDGFRRFNYRTAEKVYKEFMLYAIGRNINKYHRFLHDEIKKFEGKTEEKAA